MGAVQTKEAASQCPPPNKNNGRAQRAPFAGEPNEGGKVLRALLDGTAHVKLSETGFVLVMGNTVVQISELTSVLRVARIDDPKHLEDFSASPAMSLKGLTLEADSLKDLAPELFSGLYQGTNVLQSVTQKELETVSHYTTELYQGINPLLRDDPSAYLKGTEQPGGWLKSGSEPTDETTLNALLAHAIVASSTLNKLPNFTSRHNVSMANPRGYMTRGFQRCPESVRKHLTRCAASRGQLLFSDAAFMSTSWTIDLHDDFRPERSSGVLLKVESQTGSQIFHSSAYAVEREVVFVPGTEFRVSKGGHDGETGAAIFLLQELVQN